MKYQLTFSAVTPELRTLSHFSNYNFWKAGQFQLFWRSGEWKKLYIQFVSSLATSFVFDCLKITSYMSDRGAGTIQPFQSQVLTFGSKP